MLLLTFYHYLTFGKMKQKKYIRRTSDLRVALGDPINSTNMRLDLLWIY